MDAAVNPVDLEQDPDLATRLCLEAQDRLTAAVAYLQDADLRAPSALPGWTRGHLLTHLARNADAHAGRIAGAMDGRLVPKYPGGAEQRASEIEAGAHRPAAEVLADLASSQDHLARVLRRAQEAGWPGAHLCEEGSYAVGACPAHRLREVEMHHVDLDLGYHPHQWPAPYVAWETATVLPTLLQRLREPHTRAEVLAWLAGRGPSRAGWELEPWG